MQTSGLWDASALALDCLPIGDPASDRDRRDGPVVRVCRMVRERGVLDRQSDRRAGSDRAAHVLARIEEI